MRTSRWAGRKRAAVWIRALRPHHWAKNALLLLPILAAHLTWTPSLVVDVVTALVAFSLAASAVYVGNDIADLPADRRHPTKRHRPLASGTLSVRAAVGLIGALGVAGGLLALTLPDAFVLTLATYVGLNALYSWRLKRLLVLDVVVLASLYVLRVVAGAAVARIELTVWFLAFTIFLFLSLAFVKRVVELRRLEASGGDGAPARRGYRTTDVSLLESVGPACGLMSALVYCLYITGPVQELYEQPQLLWIGLPLFLYWIVRLWLLTVRGDVQEDPVVFVLTDPASYVVLAGFLAAVYVAA